MFDYVQVIMVQTRDMKQQMNDIKNMDSNEIVLGATRDRGAAYLPRILPRFWAKHPRIHITVVEESSSMLEDMLIHGKIDLLLGPTPLSEENITSIPLWKEQYYVVLAKSLLNKSLEFKNKISNAYSELKIKDFKEFPFLSINKDLKVGKFFYTLCNEESFSPKVVFSSKSIELILSLCVQGLGVVVCPDIFLYPRVDMSGRVFQRDLMFFPLPYHEMLSVSYIPKKYFSKGAFEFISSIQNESLYFDKVIEFNQDKREA